MMDYKFGRKNAWRRWLWNRIVGRLRVHPRDAVVLYLSGGQDLDRIEAIRRGFRESNLLCVDRNSAVVSGLRKTGKLAICGSLYDVLINFPLARRIDVVIGYFCCGLERATAEQFGRLWFLPPLSEAVIGVNMLRGRDPSSNEQRAALASILDHIYSSETPSAFKHRGLLLSANVAVTMLREMNSVEAFRDATPEDNLRMHRFIQQFVDGCSFTSYKSGPQVFDTVVYALDIRGAIRQGDPVGSYFHGIHEAVRSVRPSSVFLSKQLQRQIAATLAHRTRRAA